MSRDNSKENTSSEVDCFTAFKFPGKIGNGLKNKIKSLGCVYNSLHAAWLCPIIKEEEVKKSWNAAKMVAQVYRVQMPRGSVSPDPKIANRQTRLDILQDQVYREKRLLFTDVCSYNSNFRPEDFAEPPSEEGKTTDQIQKEADFHERYTVLKSEEEKVEELVNELSALHLDPGVKRFDSRSPTPIAKSILKELFEHEHCLILRYCHGTFWKWKKAKYQILENEELRQITYHFLMDAKISDQDGVETDFNPDKYVVDNVIDALKALCFTSHHPESGPTWLGNKKGSDPQHLISFQNGILDVKEWINNKSTNLIQHTPLLMNTVSLGFDFNPTASKPFRFLQFLNQIWPNDIESQNTLQEWMGYALIPDTSLQKIFVLIGAPRSGKGTIARVMTQLIGSTNVAGPTISSLSENFGLEPLLNKSLAIISDARFSGSKTHIVIERLLSISGQDLLTINRKYKSAISTSLATKIMIISNDIPNFRDASGALLNRYIMLNLTQSWLGKEDCNLTETLNQELDGILIWALEGLERLQKRGSFTQPMASSEIIEDLREISSPISTFVNERCELNPFGKVSAKTLYATYVDWHKSRGSNSPEKFFLFCMNFRSAFPQIRIIRPQEGAERPRYYQGLSLLSTDSFI